MPLDADLNIGSKGSGRLFHRHLSPNGKDTRSKICINPEYLWTGRGPKMHNGFSRFSLEKQTGIVLAARGARCQDAIQRHDGEQAMTITHTSQGHRDDKPAGRRSRQAAKRLRRVEFTLTEEEYGELDGAAARAGLARGAYAAQAALDAARGGGGRAGVPLREALAEVIRSAGLVRRIGVNLNQAVAKLNATGQRSDDLRPYAAESIRRAHYLDAAAEELRKRLP